MALDLDAPPRKAAARQARMPKAPSKTSAREDAANGIFQLAGFGLILGRQYADAGAINMHGAPIAHELATLAESNDGIAKGLDYLLEAGPYAGLITAVMPLALQIMANHKVIRADLIAGGGVVPPEALEAEVKATMARQASEAIKRQHEAEAELRAMAAAQAPQPPESPQAASEANGQPSMGAMSQ